MLKGRFSELTDEQLKEHISKVLSLYSELKELSFVSDTKGIQGFSLQKDLLVYDTEDFVRIANLFEADVLIVQDRALDETLPYTANLELSGVKIITYLHISELEETISSTHSSLFVDYKEEDNE